MKKIFIILSILLIPYSLKAEQFLPEFKVSYYRFDSETLRDIYNDVAVLYQGELNYKFNNNFCLFVDGGYLYVEGKPIDLESTSEEKTCMQLIPCSLGAKYFCQLTPDVEAYVGGGARYYFAKINNTSDLVKKHVDKGGLGGVIMGGLTMRCENFVFDPFVAYSTKCINFSASDTDSARNIKRHDLDVSGWSFGASIGYEF